MDFKEVGIYLIKCFFLMAPLGLANMVPVLFKKTFKFLGGPVDRGRTMGGKPLFGKTKTWRGLIVAILFGEVAWLLLYWWCGYDGFNNFVFFDVRELPIYLGFLLGAGAIIGDLIESFIKRRLSREASSRWFPWDNIDYLIGGFIVYLIFVSAPWHVYLFTLIVGLALHVLFNLLGYALKIKKEWW